MSWSAKYRDERKPIRGREILLFCASVLVVVGAGYMLGGGWWPGLAGGIVAVVVRLSERYRLRGERVSGHHDR
jgi:hypothetical protein